LVLIILRVTYFVKSSITAFEAAIWENQNRNPDRKCGNQINFT